VAATHRLKRRRRRTEDLSHTRAAPPFRELRISAWPEARYRARVNAAKICAKPMNLDWYETPRWYDIVFDADTVREADFLEEMARKHASARPGRRLRVLEPASGSGRLVAELARRGHAVTGFDLSEAMLAYARERLAKRGLSARLSKGDMADFAFRGPFDLAHCLVSTFKYLLDEQSARSHLECVARALAPGGLYVLGFHLSDYEQEGVVRERWVETRRGVTVTCNTQLAAPDRRTRLEAVRTRLAVAKKSGDLRTETHWTFRAYDARQARRLFASVPALELVALHDFTYDAARTRSLSDDQLDCVFVLRRRL
jgi:SAM-dependent methyltransferase